HTGRALLAGWLRAGLRPGHIAVGESLPAARAALARDFGISAAADNHAAIRGASVLVLAVKPEQWGALLGALRAELPGGWPLVISVVAGVRLATLESWCGPGVS